MKQVDTPSCAFGPESTGPPSRLLDPAAREAVLLSVWEARRSNIAALSQRRGLAVATLLRQ